MGKAYCTCFRLRPAPIFEASRETMETAGGYRAGKGNSISGDSSPAPHVTSCARGCVTLVFTALRSLSVFQPIERPAFQLPSWPALPKNILRGRFSRRLQQKLVLRAGMSPNCRPATTPTSSVPTRSRTFCCRPHRISNRLLRAENRSASFCSVCNTYAERLQSSSSSLITTGRVIGRMYSRVGKNTGRKWRRMQPWHRTTPSRKNKLPRSPHVFRRERYTSELPQ